MITPGELARKQALPPALVNLPEKFKNPVPMEPRTICTLHGFMSTPHCDQCDEHFPDVVKARSVPAAAAPVSGFSLEQVQEYVKQAVSEAIAFERWKASAEGQAAAAAAPTAQANPEAKAAATGGADVGAGGGG